MKVVHSDGCLLHDPPYEILSGKLVAYLESPTRYLRIKEALSEHKEAGLNSSPLFEFTELDASLDVQSAILSVHQKDYVDYLRNAYKEWVEDGGDKAAVLPECFAHGNLTQGYNASRLPPIAKADTYSSAVASVRVALTASDILWSESHAHSNSADVAEPCGVFALTRPPGHHAGTAICGGYCFFNNVAIAARFLQSRLLPTPTVVPPPRIAILDIDYHHGNGTQQIFYDDPTVFYVSLHAKQDYPYFTGGSDERGAGEGHGFNLNIPLPKGSTSDEEYYAALQEAAKHLTAYNPAYLILSLGVDTFEDDPICDFKLTREGYSRIGKLVASLHKPTLFVMEGGYDLSTIGWNVRSVLESFLATS